MTVANITTKQFIRLAEEVSGEELSELFGTWLFSTEKPILSADDQARGAPGDGDIRTAPPVARGLLEEAQRLGRRR